MPISARGSTGEAAHQPDEGEKLVRVVEGIADAQGTVGFDLTGCVTIEPETYTLNPNIGLLDQRTWGTAVMKRHQVTRKDLTWISEAGPWGPPLVGISREPLDWKTKLWGLVDRGSQG